MKRMLEAFARNTVFANILLIMIIAVGVIAALSMVRETFPAFSVDIVTIRVPYPGADPEEIEEGVSSKIEEALEGVEGIKQLTTKSAENVSTTIIEVKENYDAQKLLDDVRSKINSISTFPRDAEQPVITEILNRETVMLLTLSGDMTERRLKHWAETIKDDIQKIPEVSQIEIFGARDFEVSIEVSEERLREYGLSLSQVADAVRRGSLNLAGGTIRTEGEEIRVRTVGRKYTGEELSSIVVLARPEGELITLDRLATIRDDFAEDPNSVRVNGEPGLLLVVFKTPEEDTIAISKAVTAFVETRNDQIPEGADISILYDGSKDLQDRIDLLTRNGVIGLCLVFLLLWMFLDFRLSFWAGMGMPISIAGALVILWSMGGTINMISLFALIMVLGIIVDDAIVVGEAIYYHRSTGKSAMRSAVDGVAEVGLPVIAAVTTTIAAFIPLAYVGGVMGKFIAILPKVVIACLTVSLAECLFLLPSHLSHLPDPHAGARSRNPFKRRFDALHSITSKGLEWFAEHVYSPFLMTAAHWRYVSLCAAIAVLMISVGFVKGGLIKFVVFPEGDGFVVTSVVEFPDGTPPETTLEATKTIEAGLKRLAARTKTLSGEPMVENILSATGVALDQSGRTGPQVGSVQAVLLPSEKRGVHSKDVLVEWEKEVGAIPGVQSLTFAGLAHGPPGAPIEAWIEGGNMDELRKASEELKERLAEFDGVYQIRSDLKPGKNEMRLELKPEARALGLTVEDLARQIHAGYYGDEALRLQRGKYDVRVKVRYTKEERESASDLDNMRIRTADGRQIPLLSVADVSFSPGYSTITRTDGMRRVAVSAELDSAKANPSEIMEALEAGAFKDLRNEYPGIRISLQGEKKKMGESFSTLKIGFPVALLGIYIIMATVFRSYIQPAIIMLTVPFGIIGAIAGHLLMGIDLSMMSMFGMVALSGVVVNDAIVMIEAVNQYLAEGLPFFEALRVGGGRRFRAVFLTSITTVGGLMPLIMEKDFQAQFLIPMALSIAAGVAFATVLTLVLIPSLLVILNDFRCLWHRIDAGAWPDAREDVEPARERAEPSENWDEDGTPVVPGRSPEPSPEPSHVELHSVGSA